MRSDEIKTEAWPPAPKAGMLTGNIPNGIKITHLETGLTATCIKYRQQHINKSHAISDLELQLQNK